MFSPALVEAHEVFPHFSLCGGVMMRNFFFDGIDLHQGLAEDHSISQLANVADGWLRFFEIVHESTAFFVAAWLLPFFFNGQHRLSKSIYKVR